MLHTPFWSLFMRKSEPVFAPGLDIWLLAFALSFLRENTFFLLGVLEETNGASEWYH